MKIVKTLIIAAVCGALIFVAYRYTSKAKNNKGAPGGWGRPGSQQQTVNSVKTQVAAFSDLQDYVSTTGEIETLSSIAVFPEIGGKITRVFVSLGSPVKKGDVIAKIDPSSPGMQYALNTVYAPISGTVTATPLKKGTTVSTNTTITTIGDISNVQITANIPERSVGSLREGLKADITLQAYPDEIFRASVTHVSPVVDKTSRSKAIILTLDTYDSRVNAGMFAKVKLYTDLYTDHIVIPENAVIEKINKKYVYIVNPDGQTVAQREVSTGKTVDGMTQLLSGVNEGEKIVVEGMRVLGDGSKIQDITNGIPQATENTAAKGSGPESPDFAPESGAPKGQGDAKIPDDARNADGKQGKKQGAGKK